MSEPKSVVDKHLVPAAAMQRDTQTFKHPWNPNSEVHFKPLGDAVGFRRLGLNYVRIPPGREGYVPHAHKREEEWTFILEGEGLALIGEEEVRVGPGDFLGFPAPQIAHHIRNAGSVDLVCLMGGERLPIDIVDFPAHGKRMVWDGASARAYDKDAGEDMDFEES